MCREMQKYCEDFKVQEGIFSVWLLGRGCLKECGAGMLGQAVWVVYVCKILLDCREVQMNMWCS